MKFFDKKIYLLLILIVFLLPFSSRAAWQSPGANPVSGNDNFPFIYNDLGGSNDIYIFDHPFGLGNNLTISIDTLFVNATAARVGVGTISPVTELDVNGLFRFAQFPFSSFPLCNEDLEGSVLFNSTQDRLNICVNGDWRLIGHDGDLDGWLEPQDCNDADPNVNPSQTEICGDDVDDDCDGSLTIGCHLCYKDGDTDNYGDINNYLWVDPSEPCPPTYILTPGDCDDTDGSLNPDSEICGDLISNDCDSLVNEGCLCTAAEWNPAVCPDMSTCTTGTTAYGTKITDCSGINNRPSVSCPCVCRLDLYVSSLPPTCPTCLVSATSYTTAKKPGVNCVDTNNVEASLTVNCPSTCSTYCNNNTCCVSGTTYGLSCYLGNVVYRDSCGLTAFFNNIRNVCGTCGCSSSVCRTVCCGDGVCNNGETCATCSSDCGACDPCYACLHEVCDWTLASCYAASSLPYCSVIPASCTSGPAGTSCWSCKCFCHN